MTPLKPPYWLILDAVHDKAVYVLLDHEMRYKSADRNLTGMIQQAQAYDKTRPVILWDMDGIRQVGVYP